MPTTQTASERITEEVTRGRASRPAPASRGELAIPVGRREIGHLHGDRVFHAGFPKSVWHDLHDEGHIDFHPVFPGVPATERAGSRPTTTSAT